MPATRTETYESYQELLDGLETTNSAIEAAAALVEIAFRHQEELNVEAHGIYVLFKRQCDDAEFFRRALRDEIAEIRAAKLEIRNSERIAEWAGTSKYVVNRVISIATGINLGPPTERHSEEPPYVLKKVTADA
ncbi:hypothetical protein [Rhizobium sp. SL86]|uniref:hypothetical protein n=1 Tax=Rhizobium sp. SL86 TaxID=2995148 RepID=UPI002273B80D|nr:hypothetical protein [Rhizobium sp. SL86]MCY1668607.1 hypothetical protein [Rhizobium sp. SL86]